MENHLRIAIRTPFNDRLFIEDEYVVKLQGGGVKKSAQKAALKGTEILGAEVRKRDEELISFKDVVIDLEDIGHKIFDCMMRTRRFYYGREIRFIVLGLDVLRGIQQEAFRFGWPSNYFVPWRDGYGNRDGTFGGVEVIVLPHFEGILIVPDIYQRDRDEEVRRLRRENQQHKEKVRQLYREYGREEDMPNEYKGA
jgi:hypothetical protein